MMSCVGSKSRSPGPQLIRVNVDPPNVLTSIPEVGPKLAKVIVQFREIAGNLSPDSLGVIIRRPLDREDMRLLDFRPYLMLLAEAFGEGDETHDEGMGRLLLGGSVDSHERWGVGMPVQKEGPYAQDRVKAELASQISDLEADITACWEELQVRMREPLPLFTKPQVPINQPIIYNQPATLASINQHSMYNQPANLAPVNQLSIPNQSAMLVPINQLVIPNQPATQTLINPPVIPSLPVALLHATTQNPATPSNRDVITRIPKNLQFDGRSNWPVFRGKFERYAKLHKWSDDERTDGLVWCLAGKASDFYAVITEGRETVPYKELLHRLEERFDAKELPATAQGRFQAISQAVGESLDEWSDRVLTLATKAFRYLPQTYATEQAVAKFCYGLHDREAGLQVSMQQPKSIGEAIEKNRMFHHIQFACAPTQMDEQEDLRWVHAVGEEPIPEVVSGSALDKLSQVVGQLQGAVELLSSPCGTPDAVRCVERPVPLFRPDVDEGCYGECAAEDPYQEGTWSRGGPRGHRNQHAYERGSGSNAYHGSPGNWRNNGYRSGYQHSNFRHEGSKRGRYGSNSGEYPGMTRRGISCFKCGGLGHFQRNCLENTMSLANHEEKAPVVVADEQSGQPKVVHENQLGSVSQFCMKVQVGDIVVDAVVDSAAEVSIISDRIYEAMKQPPPKLGDVKLLMTGRDYSMPSFVEGPVEFKIGNCWYREHLHVAPTDVDMLLGFDILVNPGRAIINMAEATIIFDGQVLNLERGVPQHAKDVHDAVPLVQPNVVRDPGMVIGNITKGDHGDPVCVDAFRVQRVYGESAEAASREAAEVAQGGEIGQAAREMARSATGDGAKPIAGHVDPADVAAADRRKCATGYGVAAGDHRGGGASGYRVAPDKRREDEFRRPVRRGLRGWRPSSSRRWERSQRWKLGWRPPERLTSKICTA
ncbi:uncharacterized protein LOC127881957 [Dreissena polymorpha]|uniref:uncharacterized protein LOC127881957 n=1 Tax=Dreissena polymorpha TaxID=45954 RepID=UPI0022640484|nr:uncharacterized protein LOC127881957 [Dreissena polymorpha]XP_052286190.1 uncharacterized protein LOC127881957 [Dreissena polymorpha]